MWSRKHDECQSCGTTKEPHVAKGLCRSCYERSTESRHKSNDHERGIASAILTKEYLYQKYVIEKRSLGDIARGASCTRQYVNKKIKEYSIPLRNKAEARRNALQDKKLVFTRDDRSIILQKNEVNESFFEVFTPGMAYVLGVIFTDGWIDPGSKIDPNRKTTLKIGRLSLGQKEPELLQKVLHLMECNAKLYFRKKGVFESTIAGELYYFHINSDKIFRDLTKLGLTTAKSLTMKFPTIPADAMRHFLRGCWDGDGSIFVDQSTGNYVADFVCGSLSFITEMERVFQSAGLPTRTITHAIGKNVSYHIKYSGKQCDKLFHYFYDNTNDSFYLNRKYLLFKDAHIKYH